MEKPKRRIWWESDSINYSLQGIIHFGRVSMPVGVLHSLVGVFIVVNLVLALIFVMLPIGWVFVFITVGMLALYLATLLVIGVVALVRWVAGSIKINRPGARR